MDSCDSAPTSSPRCSRDAPRTCGGRTAGSRSSVDGRSEVEPTDGRGARAARRAGAQAGSPPASAPTAAFDELDGRVDGPTTAALAALALDDARRATARARVTRSSAVACRSRTPPDPSAEWAGAGRPTRDRSSSRRPASCSPSTRVTPADRRTRAEAVGLLAERQCDDGGWNFGNASVYDVDLRGLRADDRDRADRPAG